MIFTFIIVLSVFFSSTSQLLLKKGAASLVIPDDISGRCLFGLFTDIITNIYLIFGVVFQIIALLVWIYVLKKVDVSYAYPFISVGFVFVIVMGHFIYNEPISAMKMFGCLVICLGVFILSKS